MENAIAKWEADINLYENSTGEVFPSQYRRMNLEDMCPERLKARLRDMGPERLPGIEEILLEISDWLATEAGLEKGTKSWEPSVPQKLSQRQRKRCQISMMKPASIAPSGTAG